MMMKCTLSFEEQLYSHNRQYSDTQADRDQRNNEIQEHFKRITHVLDAVNVPINPSIASIFNTVRRMGFLSMEDMAKRIKEEQEQREVDEELYGRPNLPQDEQSRLLALFKTINNF